MRTEMISESCEEDYYNGGDTERYEYKCPCGKGKIVEIHDNIPGFRDHTVFMCCDECREKYELDTSHGVRSWELVEKK